MRRLPPVLLLAALGAAACAPDPPPDPPPAAPPSEALPYRLDRPDAAFALPGALREISGLTALPDGRLAAVQDEDGLLFLLDPATAATVAVHPFHGRGDYEGVEAVGPAVWVLESNGLLYERTGPGPSDSLRARYATGLPRRCDAEGLAYEPAAHRLLLACKEDPGPDLPDVRAIYALDLRERRLSERPVYFLDRRILDTRGTSFKPSAIAVHPRTGLVYVLSATRRALAVLDPAPDAEGTRGRLVAALALPARRFPQPEGLTFLPDGTLFIASEGAAGAATLLRFSEVIP